MREMYNNKKIEEFLNVGSKTVQNLLKEYKKACDVYYKEPKTYIKVGNTILVYMPTFLHYLKYQKLFKLKQIKHIPAYQYKDWRIEYEQ